MDHRETLLLQSIKDGIYHRSAYKALQKANEPKFSKPTKTDATRVNEDQQNEQKEKLQDENG